MILFRKRNTRRSLAATKGQDAPAETQTLEDRKLLSATVSNGTLTVHSENVPRAVNQTIISENNRHVTVWQNGKSQRFPQHQVQQIVIHGTNEKDVLDNRTAKSMTVYANGGHDVIRAGSGHNVIYGGSGNDKIYFHRGGGVAYGGRHNDVISAAGTNNQITAYGQGGRDRIHGGNRRDKIFGGKGNDDLHGHDGNDLVSGGHGNDNLNDGDGRDVVLGGGGLDKFFMTYGNRDDGDRDLMSLGGRSQLKTESYFARDFWFSYNGFLRERDWLRKYA